MLHKILLGAGILSLFAGLLFSSCHWRSHHHGMSKEKIDWFQKHLASRLDLNADQKVKLGEIAKRFSDKIPEWKNRRVKMADVMIQNFGAENLDAKAIQTELDSMQQHFTEMKPMIVQAISEFHAILTPEQRKKFVEIMKKRHEKYKR